MADNAHLVYTRSMHKRGYTLVETILVVAILAILAALTVVGSIRYYHHSKLSRVSKDLADIASGLAQYAEDNNYQYPADSSRALPAGLDAYLANGTWPKSAWPHGVFDWDNWTIGGQSIYQVSYRMCDLDDPIEYCRDPILFPTFNRNSAIYYCISGSCIPHEAEPTAPAYCVNCAVKKQNY